MDFVAQVKELHRFCDGEKIPGYYLRNRTQYVKQDCVLAERWLELCSADRKEESIIKEV